MKRFLFLALMLLASLSLAADREEGMTGLDGLAIVPQAYQTNALLIESKAGVDALAVTIGGAITAQGVLTLDNAETIDNTNDGYVEIQGAGGSDNTDIRVDLDGTYPVWSSPTDTTIGFAEIIAGASGDTISNPSADTWVIGCAGACTNAVDLTIDVDSSVGAAGPVVLSSTSSTVIEVAETLDVSAAGGLVLGNDETITNAVNGEVLVTATAFQSSGSIEAQGGNVILQSGDTITNAAADVAGFTCSGACADATDVHWDIDGTYPVMYSIADTAVGCSDTFMADGGVTITCTDCITEENVANTTYTIATPLYAWRTSAGAAPLPLSAATTPNTATEGSWETLEWLSGEQASLIETTIIVPENYVSGMSLVAYVMNDAAAANTAETLEVDWYTAADGAADNPGMIDEGAVAITNAETVDKETVLLDGAATIAAGQPLRVLFGFTAIDQTMHVAGLGFTYVGK